VPARQEHLREFADAAYRWGVVSADFAESSNRLAGLARVTVDHADDAIPEVAQLREFADRLDEWAANARRDALDIGEFAATLRKLADETQ
jgi:hypothetical protein